MTDDLSIDVIGDLSENVDCEILDLIGLEGRERSQKLIRTKEETVNQRNTVKLICVTRDGAHTSDL